MKIGCDAIPGPRLYHIRHDGVRQLDPHLQSLSLSAGLDLARDHHLPDPRRRGTALQLVQYAVHAPQDPVRLHEFRGVQDPDEVADILGPLQIRPKAGGLPAVLRPSQSDAQQIDQQTDGIALGPAEGEHRAAAEDLLRIGR